VTQAEPTSDIGSDTAKQYGLTCDLPDDLAVHDNLGFGLQRVSDGRPRTLPLPATYVTDRDGVTRWAFVNGAAGVGALPRPAGPEHPWHSRPSPLGGAAREPRPSPGAADAGGGVRGPYLGRRCQWVLPGWQA
jgi:hypothetical protein